jgi:Xaa-Pro aminopeptidase
MKYRFLFSHALDESGGDSCTAQLCRQFTPKKGTPMLSAMECISRAELELRHEKVRAALGTVAPDAGGILVFSRVNIYYLSGTLGNGVLWLPLEGEPVLLVRKGIERAELESSLENILPYRSYKDLEGLCSKAGSPLTKDIAVEMDGLNWTFGAKLAETLKDKNLVKADFALVKARSVKTEWELKKMRLAGKRHHKALYQDLPKQIRPGMSERDISHKAWEVFFALGHGGILRMSAPGEECFLGHVAAGESGNHPSVFNGPVGLRGEHPAVPCMGYAGSIWQQGAPLTCDIGFCLEGYMCDKTQVYFAGKVPPAAAAAHQFCIDVQQWLCEELKPGAVPSDLYKHCTAWAEKAGFGEGFMALGENRVVFLGHGIGLVIDEYPPIAERFQEPLEEGMVLALEPKIGIPGLGMVGVENTFEVTAAGGLCLSGDAYDIIVVD